MGRIGGRKNPLKDQNPHRNVTPPKRKASDDYVLMQKTQNDLLKSPKSDSGLRKPDLRARYWKFLFDNLQRAVDAIYETCEQDESVVECKVGTYVMLGWGLVARNMGQEQPTVYM